LVVDSFILFLVVARALRKGTAAAAWQGSQVPLIDDGAHQQHTINDIEQTLFPAIISATPLSTDDE
jgi:hypothetical protein